MAKVYLFKIPLEKKDGMFLIPTFKGNFLVRNYTDVDPDDSGISVHDDDGTFLTQISGVTLTDENDTDDAKLIVGAIEDCEEL